MKKACFFFPVFFLLFFTATSQDTLRKIENKFFRHGERLIYRVSYGWMNAGFARLDIFPDAYEKCGRETFRCVGIGESAGVFDWFFKVRDRYETYLDKEMIAPVVFIRRVDEDGYKINQDYVFDHSLKTVFNGKEFIDIPSYTQDMLSAFYYARCIDFSKAAGGEVFSIPVFVDDSVYHSKIKFIRREIKKTDLGTFRCMLFRPVIQTGRIFKNEEDLEVWISDDDNKIPVYAQASILVGSLKMELFEFSGLAGPLSKVEKK